MSESRWSDDSLRLIRERYARPISPRAAARQSHGELEPAIRRACGLSPAARAELDAQAKAAAMRFAWSASRRSAAGIQQITAPMSRELLIALALNLAEGVRPGDMRLAQVVRAVDDGMPEGAGRQATG